MNENNKTPKTRLAELLGKVVGISIGLAWYTLFLYLAWNAIATRLNLPTFSYWICYAFSWVLYQTPKFFQTINSK